MPTIIRQVTAVFALSGALLSVEPVILHACRTDAAVCNRLLGEWRQRLTTFGGA